MNDLTLCTIVKNEARYLLEWVAYHRVIGVDGFVVFNNESSDETRELLQSLSRHEWFQYFDWPTIDGISPQISAYNHCLTLLREKTRFVANIDADEFISPVQRFDLISFLRNVSPEVGALAMNQRVVGSNGHEKYLEDLVVSRFQRGSNSNYTENHFFKTIYRPECVSEVNGAHSVSLSYGRYCHFDMSEVHCVDHPGRSSMIDHSSVALNHYILKSKEEFALKKMRGGAAASSLQERMARYDEGFFINRDAHINECLLHDAVRLIPQIKEMMHLLLV